MSPDLDVTRENIRKQILSTLDLMCPDTGTKEVQWKKGDRTTVYSIHVCQPALGQLLGIGGKNIEAIRVLVSAMAGAHGFRAIVDNAQVIEKSA